MSLNHELIDFGNGRKLERFGTVILDRPETNATEKPLLGSEIWKTQATAKFEESRKGPGEWIVHKPLPEAWTCSFKTHGISINFPLHLGKYKHVGLFPEQKPQWELIGNRVKPGHRILNLFAYTGAASLIAAAAGGDVYHVDASRSIVRKAARAAEENGINNIHWVVEDALNFANKEVKRGRQYDMIIMDPPIYGRGKGGEHWRLEDKLESLVKTAANLMSPGGLLILNTYSPKITLDEMTKVVYDSGFREERKGILTLNAGERKLALSRYLICTAA
jgi:23S rRNA (cytosine1962-C5)-methyltransferase